MHPSTYVQDEMRRAQTVVDAFGLSGIVPPGDARGTLVGSIKAAIDSDNAFLLLERFEQTVGEDGRVVPDKYNVYKDIALDLYSRGAETLNGITPGSTNLVGKKVISGA